MALPPIVSAADWQQARDELLAAEKDATRALDALAARRRRLPMTPFSSDYSFATPDGARSLLDLFGDNTQLVVYQFMDNGPDDFCPGCTMFTDNVPPHAPRRLADLGIAWRTVSDMPLPQLASYWETMGWTLPIASSRGTSFSQDCGAGGGFMLSAFVRDGDAVYRTWNTTSRGVDRLVFLNSLLDVTVYGRQEDWEDSPSGWPQHPTYG